MVAKVETPGEKARLELHKNAVYLYHFMNATHVNHFKDSKINEKIIKFLWNILSTLNLDHYTTVVKFIDENWRKIQLVLGLLNLLAFV